MAATAKGEVEQNASPSVRSGQTFADSPASGSGGSYWGRSNGLADAGVGVEATAMAFLKLSDQEKQFSSMNYFIWRKEEDLNKYREF
ncbi:hypothetical protein SUZIE_167735 [Sciurus carolinensis]|uniref:Uncharacterized protein n=1 Tax=Sciurus carolinensis TaxID=30640 RepID=A0AA41N2R9_SCICA|nr:hypothetical protein [Sciurus carolinensis]